MLKLQALLYGHIHEHTPVPFLWTPMVQPFLGKWLQTSASAEKVHTCEPRYRAFIENKTESSLITQETAHSTIHTVLSVLKQILAIPKAKNYTSLTDLLVKFMNMLTVRWNNQVKQKNTACVHSYTFSVLVTTSNNHKDKLFWVFFLWWASKLFVEIPFPRHESRISWSVNAYERISYSGWFL